ncbi:MAG TPA: hypothetical protein VN811_08440, partial [Thermoanaerobaculia bacterium]|nr:hypothetical protein [Thermoanaerobaculia bacterium]
LGRRIEELQRFDHAGNRDLGLGGEYAIFSGRLPRCSPNVAGGVASGGASGTRGPSCGLRVPSRICGAQRARPWHGGDFGNDGDLPPYRE